MKRECEGPSGGHQEAFFCGEWAMNSATKS